MGKLKIKNRKIEIDKYLTQAELKLFSLSLKGKLLLLIFGYIRIGTFRPEGFTAPKDFYLVRHKDKYFISYRQGWGEEFYYPEAKI